MPVPSEYVGVWKRTRITTRKGLDDTTTQVRWLQTSCDLFADLRVPTAVSSKSLKALSDLDLDELTLLTKQDGFAGHTVVEGDICQWHREFSYLSSDGKPDIGRMTFHSPSEVSENGLDGGYHEDWVRLAAVHPSDTFAFPLQAVGSASRKGLLLGCGAHFIFASDRVVPLPSGKSLLEAVQAASTLDEARGLLAMEISFGTIQSGEKPWAIELSTLPDRTGGHLLPESMSLSGLKYHAEKQSHLEVGADSQRWILQES